MSKRGRPFEPGNNFGKGRPPGSRNKRSLFLQELLLNNGESIVWKVIERALQGDPKAMSLAMDRLIPPLKPVSELPVESPKAPQGVRLEIVDFQGNEIASKPDPSEQHP